MLVDTIGDRLDTIGEDEELDAIAKRRRVSVYEDDDVEDGAQAKESYEIRLARMEANGFVPAASRMCSNRPLNQNHGCIEHVNIIERDSHVNFEMNSFFTF